MKLTRCLPYCFFLFFICLSACSPVSTPAIPLTTRSSGDILYQEEFEDNTTGWARISNDNGIMDYDGGGYRILVRQPKLNVWSTSEKDFSDVRVEADVIKLNGPEENRMGLICRYQNGDYYFFIISNDGYYVIGKFIGGLTLLLGQSEMQVSETIQTDTMNHLRADCIGDKLTFYINFTEVASATDTDFPSGDVGVLAGAFAEPGVDVLFDHFVVIQP
jgi:pectate lyase